MLCICFGCAHTLVVLANRARAPVRVHAACFQGGAAQGRGQCVKIWNFISESACIMIGPRGDCDRRRTMAYDVNISEYLGLRVCAHCIIVHNQNSGKLAISITQPKIGSCSAYLVFILILYTPLHARIQRNHECVRSRTSIRIACI